MARAAIQHQSRRASQRKLEIEQVRLALDTPQYRVAVRDEYAQLQATLSDMQATGHPAFKLSDTFAAAVKRAVQQTCQRCAGRALSRVGPEPSELILSFALDDALAQIASRKKDASDGTWKDAVSLGVFRGLVEEVMEDSYVMVQQLSDNSAHAILPQMSEPTRKGRQLSKEVDSDMESYASDDEDAERRDLLEMLDRLRFEITSPSATANPF